MNTKAIDLQLVTAIFRAYGRDFFRFLTKANLQIPGNEAFTSVIYLLTRGMNMNRTDNQYLTIKLNTKKARLIA